MAFSRPLARLRETVTIVRQLLRGERVTFEGRVFSLQDAGLGRSTPEEPPPVFIAALGPAMLEMAGEIADGVLLNWTAAGRLAESVARVRQGAAKAGRDPSESCRRGVRAGGGGDDVAPARASLQRQIAVYAGMSYYRSFFDNAGFEKEMAAVDAALERGDREAAYSAITPEMQDQVAVVGTAEECRAEVERRRSLGLEIPVVAPFPVGPGFGSYRETLEAMAGG